MKNKKKNLSFDAEFDPRHYNYDVQIDVDVVIADADHMVPIPDARKIFSEMHKSHKSAK